MNEPLVGPAVCLTFTRPEAVDSEAEMSTRKWALGHKTELKLGNLNIERDWDGQRSMLKRSQ